MHGPRGGPLRGRVILLEFVAGTVGSLALGVGLLGRSGAASAILGIWLLGLAANYLLLTVHATDCARSISLGRPGALESELAGVDLRSDLRRYTRGQVLVLLPVLRCDARCGAGAKGGLRLTPPGVSCC